MSNQTQQGSHQLPDQGIDAAVAAGHLDRDKLNEALDLIRPAIQADGGDIELVGVDGDGVVQVELSGACGGCPMSMITLKSGIERILKDRVPGVSEVVAV